MRIAILGCGAMGTVMGAFLTRNGCPVDMVDNYQAHVDALNEKGAHIVGMVDMTVPVRAMTPEQMEGIYDLVFLFTKQTANDQDGIIAMADKMLEQNPANALAQKIRLQAYLTKKDYAKVIELGEAAAAAQPDETEKSDVYFILGAAYNAKEMKPQAIEALKKVTAGDNVAAAQKSVAELSK